MRLRKKLSALFLSVTMLMPQVSGMTLWAAQEKEETVIRASDQGKILELSFDGKENGLTSPGVKITMNGNLSLSFQSPTQSTSSNFIGNRIRNLS